MTHTKISRKQLIKLINKHPLSLAESALTGTAILQALMRHFQLTKDQAEVVINKYLGWIEATRPEPVPPEEQEEEVAPEPEVWAP